MYMHLFNAGPRNVPNVKADMLRTVDSIRDYILTEATDSEMFTWQVVREVFANAYASDIERAIKKLSEPAIEED